MSSKVMWGGGALLLLVGAGVWFVSGQGGGSLQRNAELRAAGVGVITTDCALGDAHAAAVPAEEVRTATLGGPFFSARPAAAHGASHV